MLAIAASKYQFTCRKDANRCYTRLSTPFAKISTGFLNVCRLYAGTFENATSDAHKAVLDRVQEERDLLAAKLSDAERNPPNWDRVKGEFGATWNSFVTDLNVLELRLQDAETAKQQKA